MCKYVEEESLDYFVRFSIGVRKRMRRQSKQASKHEPKMIESSVLYIPYLMDRRVPILGSARY
jgi:hypothetical protein